MQALTRSQYSSYAAVQACYDLSPVTVHKNNAHDFALQTMVIGRCGIVRRIFVAAMLIRDYYDTPTMRCIAVRLPELRMVFKHIAYFLLDAKPLY